MHINQTYRIYPTNKQKLVINQWLGSTRKVWNIFLASNIKKYEEEQKFNFSYLMQKELTALKKTEEYAFLNNCPSQVMQQKLQDLDTAITRAYKKTSGFPKFKSKKTDVSGIRFPQGWKINDNGKLYLPKLKSGIKIVEHRKINGTPSMLTLKRDAVGDYWVSILYDTADFCGPKNEIKAAIGIDVGIKEFAVLSNGDKISNKNFFKKNEKKIAKLQRSHLKKKKGSKNKEKERLLLAREHAKIANKRSDFVKQTASSIAKNYDLICTEDLNISGMIQNRNLAKSIADVGWGMFTTELEWQCEKRGKYFVQIDRYYPSSKTCSCCGHKQDMPLEVREYNCSKCGLVLDRDLNAAINILNEGIKVRTAGTAEINACGEMSRITDSAQEAILL